MGRLNWFVSFTDRPLRQQRRHQHAVEELVYYLDGEGELLLGDGSRRIPIRPRTMICLPRGLPHWEVTPTGLSLHCAGLEMAALPGREPLVLAEAGRFAHLWEAMACEARARVPGSADVLQGLVELTLGAFRGHAAQADSSHPLVERLQALLQRGAGDPAFELRRSMATLPISPDHLCRLFAQATGQTPNRYLCALRLERARTLLRLGGLGVAQIARQCGFADPAYFTRVFAREHGAAPSAWAARRQAGETAVR